MPTEGAYSIRARDELGAMGDLFSIPPLPLCSVVRRGTDRQRGIASMNAVRYSMTLRTSLTRRPRWSMPTPRCLCID
jgi:hypothetical protein